MAEKTRKVTGKNLRDEPIVISVRPGSRLEKKHRFIQVLAEMLGGSNQARMSIGLEMGKPDAAMWAKPRNETPLMGYPSIEEATEQLTEFLG